jgi:hypothetical protein
MAPRSWRARSRGLLLIFLLVGPAFAQTPAPPADTPPDLEDRQGWSADRKVDEATKRAADLKAQAHRRKDEPCPAIDDWDKWFQDTLDLEASWVAMRDVRDKVRRSGAGGDKVRPFREAFGTAAEWEALVKALRQSMVDCARQLNVKRAGSSEELRMVTEREHERRAIELGDLGFGPRVQGGRGPRPSG